MRADVPQPLADARRRLPTLTTKQRGLLHLVEAEGGVTAAAARLGTSRGNVYAGLAPHRAPARRARHRRAAALHRERRAPAVGPIVTAYRRAVAPWSTRLGSVDDLAPGARVVVGCSGGADSLALLALACAPRPRRGRGLRRSRPARGHRPRRARGHRRRARRRRRGACRSRSTVDAGANLEARARDARYAALERVADEIGAVAILVGHTRRRPGRDRAARAAAGERHRPGWRACPRSAGAIRRPLLALRRADTHEICARLGVGAGARSDERRRCTTAACGCGARSSRVSSAARDRDLVEVLARQADVLRDDDELLDALAAEHDARRRGRARGAAARARPARSCAGWLGPPPPSSATVDAVLEVARGDAARGGAPRRAAGRAGRRPARISSPAPSRAALAPAALAVPGRTRFGSVVVETWIETRPPVAWPDGRDRRRCRRRPRAGRARVVRSARAGRAVPAPRAGAGRSSCATRSSKRGCPRAGGRRPRSSPPAPTRRCRRIRRCGSSVTVSTTACASLRRRAASSG